MKKCPYCAEEIQDEAILCKHCKSDVRVQIPQQQPMQTNQLNEEEKKKRELKAELEYVKKKKSFGLALFLNFLWAGWGNIYADVPNGSMIASINIIGFIITIGSAGIIPVSLFLFIWAAITCWNHLKIQNIELKYRVW